MGLFQDLKARGLVFQTTGDERFEAWLAEKPRTLYCGFDPTADSLHIGSLVPLLTLSPALSDPQKDPLLHLLLNL